MSVRHYFSAQCLTCVLDPPNVVIIPEHGAEKKYAQIEPRAPVSPSKRPTGTNQKPFQVESTTSKSGPSMERLRDDKQILAMQVSFFKKSQVLERVLLEQ